MPGKKPRKASELRARVERALEDRQWGGIDLGDILDKAREDEVDTLKPFVPAILAHHDWTVRADALEFVGVHHLRQFLGLVKERLRDRNRIVRGYALSAYYDLLGSKALPLLKEACRAGDIRFRVEALVLCYVETRDRGALNELRRILMRKRCYSGHRYAALNTFDAYVDVGHYPEIIELFEAVQGVLPKAPRAYGLDKDIPNVLAKWKRSARKVRWKPPARFPSGRGMIPPFTQTQVRAITPLPGLSSETRTPFQQSCAPKKGSGRSGCGV